MSQELISKKKPLRYVSSYKEIRKNNNDDLSDCLIQDTIETKISNKQNRVPIKEFKIEVPTYNPKDAQKNQITESSLQLNTSSPRKSMKSVEFVDCAPKRNQSSQTRKNKIEPQSMPPDIQYNYLTGTQMNGSKIRIYETIYEHYAH